MRAIAFVALTAILALGAQAANNRTDRVAAMPQCGPLKSAWYSGFLNVRPTGKGLHYVFIESLSQPSPDPIMIWFNGGPGCSSLLGMFQENGPYIIDDGETIIKPNPYPWNQESNLLYIESPAGVGFSYGQTPEDLIHTDMTQSEDAFAALQDFYMAFPAYKNNSLYITGESYAGIYGPYLAW